MIESIKHILKLLFLKIIIVKKLLVAKRALVSDMYHWLTGLKQTDKKKVSVSKLIKPRLRYALYLWDK